MARISTEGAGDRGEVVHERTRRLALVRSEYGPWIPTVSIAKPHLKITGLVDATIKVFMRTAFGETVQEHSRNGIFALAPALWTRVVCTPKCKTVICVVVSGPAD